MWKGLHKTTLHCRKAWFEYHTNNYWELWLPYNIFNTVLSMKWFSSNFNPCLEKQRDWEIKEIRKESKLRTSKLHDIPAARQRKESHLITVYDNKIDRYRPRGWRSSSPPLYDPIFHGQSKLTLGLRTWGIGLVDQKLCVWVKQDCAESDLRKARCQGFPCSLGER